MIPSPFPSTPLLLAPWPSCGSYTFSNSSTNYIKYLLALLQFPFLWVLISNNLLWSDGTGQIAGTFSQQPMWQAKPHTSHTTPWRVRPTISEVQWLHFVGDENVRTRNWWDFGLGGRWGAKCEALCRSSPCGILGSWKSQLQYSIKYVKTELKCTNH